MRAMRIALLTTGGTIAMQASDKGANLGAPPPFAAMLGRALPDVEVVVRPVLSKPSKVVRPSRWRKNDNQKCSNRRQEKGRPLTQG